MKLRTVQTGGILEIVLNAPEIHNALGPDEARELRFAIIAASADPDVRVVVLTGEGKSFCSGGNLRHIVDLVSEGAPAVTNAIYSEYQGMMRAIETMRPPLLCAVDGTAIGLGCDLAFAADLVFAGSHSSFGQGWATLGLISAPGGVRLVMRRGGARALWRLIAEQRIGPLEAERLGLVIAVENARAAAMAAATTIAKLPSEAVEATRTLSRIEGFDAHLESALAYQTAFLTSPTFSERAQRALARRDGFPPA